MKKPLFFAIMAACLAVTAASLGFAASRYLAARTYMPPPPPAPVRGAVEAGRKPEPLPPERWTNVFAPRQGMEIPTRAAAGGAAPAAAPTEYVLLGTISAEVPSNRRAILWAPGMAEPRLFREHAEIEPGLQVAAIERERVWLRRGKAREKLDLLPVGSRIRPGASPPAAASATAAAPSARVDGDALKVSQTGENAFSLDQASLAQLTGNINQYMTQVRLIPYFEGNRSAGYRLAAMRPGSAFEKLGFRGGDVIQQVNGLDLSSPERMYTIFENLKDQKRVSVDILRQGRKSTITYEIR